MKASDRCDYYLPCLSLPLEEEKPIGIWGQRHKCYLKEHRKATYTTLLTSGRLNKETETEISSIMEKLESPINDYYRHRERHRSC